MTIFWIMAAGLTGLALLFVLPPLLAKRERIQDVDQDALNLAVFRRQLQELDADLAAGELDQHQYKAARRDLERELLYDVGGSADQDRGRSSETGGRWVAALLAVAVPAVAFSLYLHLGNNAIIPRLEAAAVGQPAAAHQGQGGGMPPLEVMVQRLADKLERSPENLEGWLMLGRSYLAIGQPGRALHALEKAYDLGPENPDVLVAYAEVLATTNDSELAGRPAELIQSALKIDPEHIKARWLEGLVSFQSANYDRAAEQWGALLATFDPKSQEAAELERYVAEARSRAGSEPGQTTELASADQETAAVGGNTVNPEEKTAPLPAATATGVTVEVSLAERLRPEADLTDTVFVYAKAVSGPPMPLAAHRAQVADLPLTVTLDDSMAMSPAMRLSGFDKVTVGARISKSGQAMPRSGDLEGEVSPVEPGQAGTVKILIDRVRP